jgi:hypothetical protein
MKEIRRKRLSELLSGPRFNGDRAAFCAASGISKGRLSQLLDPKESFGDVASRNLCDGLGLDQGWFDSEPGEATAQQGSPPVQENDLSPLAMDVARWFDRVPESIRSAVYANAVHLLAAGATGNVLTPIPLRDSDAAQAMLFESHPATQASDKTPVKRRTGQVEQ